MKRDMQGGGAVKGSPVPPYAQRVIENPRGAVDAALERGDYMACLLRVGELHGHFCPGSAMGVMAAAYGLRALGVEGSSGGMEDLMAVVETNACFADGVQFVSGCTLGNNALVYRDLGKTAVTFGEREKPRGVRVRILPEVRALIAEGSPDFYRLMSIVITNREQDAQAEAAFKRAGWEAASFLVRQPFESFLASEIVPLDIPAYAPITDTAVCGKCGEEFMATKRAAGPEGGSLCRACAGAVYCEVESQGIVRKND